MVTKQAAGGHDRQPRPIRELRSKKVAVTLRVTKPDRTVFAWLNSNRNSRFTEMLRAPVAPAGWHKHILVASGGVETQGETGKLRTTGSRTYGLSIAEVYAKSNGE